jgi:hypothetical protein
MSQLDKSSMPETVLRSTVISNEAPGPIVHDFQVILNYIAEAPPQLTDALMLPTKVIKPLNEQMIRRIEHGLARPQQKSYPHINGLYLLLRVMGMTMIEADGRKPVLVVDPLVEESWRQLSPEERYFTLLESWLLRADSEIIGERAGLFEFRHPLYLWSELFQILERDSAYNGDWVELVRYWPGLHHLALMELFGLVEIDHAAPQPQKGWQIDGIRATEWGEALRNLLVTELPSGSVVWDYLSHPENTPSGVLQPVIQPYRPGWQRTLQLPNAAFQKGSFVFKVSLQPDVWRQIIIPAESTLEDLCDAILSAYKFDKDHLYRFLYPTRFGVTREVLYASGGMMDGGMFEEDGLRTDEVRIGDLPARPGFQMIFNFDFGDDWNFHLLLEHIDPPDPKAKRYRIGKRVGKSPQQYPNWG